MGWRCLWAGSEYHIFLGAFEDGIEVYSITVDEASCLYAMAEKEIDLLQVLEGTAPLFEIEDESLRVLGETIHIITVLDYFFLGS